MMKQETLFGIMESILFAVGSPVELDKLSEVLELSREECCRVTADFVRVFNAESRGMKIIRLNDALQMVSKSEYHPYIAKILERHTGKGLSQSSLETLSIIAYNQPATKAMVDAVRGVDSYNSIVRLLERELIEQRGRLDAPGRPMLYGTTSEFLRVFGMETLDELPKLEQTLLKKLQPLDNLTFSDLEEKNAAASDPEEALV